MCGYLRLAIVCVAALAAACGDDGGGVAGPVDVQTVPIQAELDDTLVVQGGALSLTVTGHSILVPFQASVTFDGGVAGNPVAVAVPAELTEAEESLAVRVPWELIEGHLGVVAGDVFEGALHVTVSDLGGTLVGVASVLDVQVAFSGPLTPSLSGDATFDVFLNDVTAMPADGVLSGDEGTTQVLVEGTFTRDGGGAVGISEVIAVAEHSARRTAQLPWPAWLFGVQPGTFTGTLTPRNEHRVGGAVDGTPLTVQVTLRASEIDAFDPGSASRGQAIEVVGRGFVPVDTERGISMFFELDGDFTTDKGTEIPFRGDDAIRLAPEIIRDHTTAVVVLRSEVKERGGRLELTGLTATPGTFQGRVTPIVIGPSGLSRGAGQTMTLRVAPTHQHVYVKFLPQFSEALDRFGLRNVESEIRALIFDVARRDYTGLRISFSDQRPTTFVEYTVIELTGPDPNDAGLLGLDNSAGKDTGNIRLSDIIGSENAESTEQGFYSFGGVFVDSFRTFSPRLAGSSDISDPLFDEIFSPFMPELGGTKVDAAEWPDGERATEIARAIDAMGHLIGNTITHEIGHSLGLAFFQEDLFTATTRFHNDFDKPGAIMDSGGLRPFRERIEIEGGPAEFNERNWNYLQTILGDD